jgi:tRNA/tmRNA/rRNA uracil-C5-methylase (TrmA/RlmC/RlmD family)
MEATAALTPTQLRNARKRRAKQKAAAAQEHASTTTTTRSSSSAASKRTKRARTNGDPSLQYLHDPTQAPLVRAARQFFASALNKHASGSSGSICGFAVHVQDVVGWRTVAKLAVRNAKVSNAKKGHQQSQLTIGLFEPGTHNVIPMVPDNDTTSLSDQPVAAAVGAAHHAAITAAIFVVQRVARRLGIVAYDEVSGTGQLRHVALAVQRRTQRVQCTLVWNCHANGHPTNADARGKQQSSTVSHNTFGSLDKILDRLVQALIEEASLSTGSRMPNASTTPDVSWHSIWWHGSATGKHANAIFDHDGQWKLLYSYENDDNTLKSNGKRGRSGQNASPSLLPPLACRGITEYLECAGCPVRFPLYFPPQVFRQGNLTAFTAIVQSIRGYLQEKYHMDDDDPLTTKPIQCLELYGGVGTIGLHLADLCSSLVSSDENPHNVTCFEASSQILMQQLALLPSPQRRPELPTIRYQSASAAQMVARGEHDNVDVIVVDPPRKGLEDTVSAALVKASRSRPRVTNAKPTSSSPTPSSVSAHRHQTLVYVSCGFDAFQRDFDILTRSDSAAHHHPWKLHRAEGHVLFPGSNAIETLAFFTRENPHYQSP